MRSDLEKAIVHLLNEETDKAEQFIHKFIVDRARQIHESLREGDDALDLEDEEAFYTEDDLEGEESVDDAASELAGDMEVDLDADDTEMDADGDMEGSDDDADDSDDDDDDEEMEDRLEDLEAKLEELSKEFEELMGGAGEDLDLDMDADMDATGEVDGDDFTDSDFTDDMDDSEAAAALDDDMSGEDEDEVKEGTLTITHDDEDDFDDLAESITSELDKVVAALADGKEIGAGDKIAQNTKSTVGHKKADMADAKPVQVKSTEHKGFDREKAPAVADMKPRRNTRTKATDDMKTVSKEGDAAAELNKDKSENNRSVLPESKAKAKKTAK